jgi:hypothetical protein
MTILQLFSTVLIIIISCICMIWLLSSFTLCRVNLQPVEIDLLCSFHIFGRGYLSGECCHLLSTLVLRICSFEVVLLRKIFVIRSHWVGKSSGPQVSHRKPRQIFDRLSDPSVKIRLMKCRKNLKSSRDLKSVLINEDLTHTRNKIFFLARQLQKNKSVEQVWTTNGNIRLKDSHGRIYETDTIDRFLQVAVQLDEDRLKVS